MLEAAEYYQACLAQGARRLTQDLDQAVTDCRQCCMTASVRCTSADSRGACCSHEEPREVLAKEAAGWNLGNFVAKRCRCRCQMSQSLGSSCTSQGCAAWRGIEGCSGGPNVPQCCTSVSLAACTQGLPGCKDVPRVPCTLAGLCTHYTADRGAALRGVEGRSGGCEVQLAPLAGSCPAFTADR